MQSKNSPDETQAPTLIEVMARAAYGTMPVGEREWRDAPRYTADRCRTIMTAAIAALDAAGYVIVPREPTEAMAEAYIEKHHDPHGAMLAKAVWRAMVKATTQGDI